MNPAWHAQVTRLYQAALELAPEQRKAFLTIACNGDEALRQEIEALLSYESQSGGLLDHPAMAAPLAAQLLESHDAALSGQRLGHYQMLSLLGRGGMGDVWLAEDTQLARQVAIKLLPIAFTSDVERLRRFAQEARTASALNHPNIITIHEIGQAGSRHYLVTEYIEGETLRQHLLNAPQQRLTTVAALDLATQIATALNAAHTAGITHRDIKPENVMVRRDGLVKVLDFGLAKLTEPTGTSGKKSLAENSTAAGMIMGTPRYMSPEQARGEKVDARTDIFSFGVILYEMLAGRAPFAGTTTSEMIAALLRDEPAPLPDDMPPALQNIVNRALRKDRSNRYANADALLADLTRCKETMMAEKFANSLSAASEHKTPQSFLNKAFNPHRALIVLTGVVLLAVAVWGWFAFNRTPGLTSKDTVLLADFDNQTGDGIFDGALKQWLATQLEQSQVLRVFPDARVQQTLRQMDRPATTRVTPDIALEVCQRQNLKAFITGSIVAFGSRYVVTLTATQSQNQEILSRAQAEAASKEQVLQALTEATARLSEKLGPGLRAAAPPNRLLLASTTGNIEALKAISECNELAALGRFAEALPFAKRALELDPNLRDGYSLLAIISLVAGQPEAAADYQDKAWQVMQERLARKPEQVSESSLAGGQAWYHRLSTGNQTKSVEYGLLLQRLAPKFAPAPNDLGFSYVYSGQYEPSIPLFQEAIRLNPDFAAPYRGLAEAYMRFNRFAEAKGTIDQALGLKLEFADFHTQLFQLAFIAVDTPGQQAQLAWAKGRAEEFLAFDWQTQAAAYAGSWHKAQELSSQAINLAALGGNREMAARLAVEQALRGAMLGDCRASRTSIAQGLSFDRGRLPLSRAALALTFCGASQQAQPLIAELSKRFPEDLLIHSLWLPTTRAAQALQRGNARQALEQLQATRRAETVGEFWPQYLRGLAHLQLKQNTEAAAAFQHILDHRGYAPLSLWYPLAQLGLAKATQSQTAYDKFLAGWQEADTDLPILKTARQMFVHP